MENRFDIIVRDKQTKKQKIAISISDDWIDIDDKEFVATIDDVVDRIIDADQSGVLFSM